MVKPTILIADDEAGIVDMLCAYFSPRYDVLTACSGQEAIRRAERQPDLILLDLMMPGLDGLQACMRIREFSNVPIIILTAKGEDADKLIGFESGADDYITKPFNILELKARIRALFRRAGMTQQESMEWAGDRVRERMAQTPPNGEEMKLDFTFDPSAHAWKASDATDRKMQTLFQ